MKKFIYFLLLFVVMLILPINVFAEGEDEGEKDNETAEVKKEEVLVYFFRGDGCPHCQEAEEWFASLSKDLKSKFDIVDLETWNDADNASLMSQVAEARGESEEATGVPYIIIGDKSWVGFAETMTSEITSQIESVYEQATEDRYDALDTVGFEGERNILDNDSDDEEEESNSSDVVSLFVILVVVAGVCFGVYKTRQSV